MKKITKYEYNHFILHTRVGVLGRTRVDMDSDNKKQHKMKMANYGI